MIKSTMPAQKAAVQFAFALLLIGQLALAQEPVIAPPGDVSEIKADLILIDARYQKSAEELAGIRSAIAADEETIRIGRPLLESDEALKKFMNSDEGRRRIRQYAPAGFNPSPGQVRYRARGLVQAAELRVSRLRSEQQHLELVAAAFEAESNSLQQKLAVAGRPVRRCNISATLAIFQGLKAPATAFAAVSAGTPAAVYGEMMRTTDEIIANQRYLDEGYNRDVSDASNYFHDNSPAIESTRTYEHRRDNYEAEVRRAREKFEAAEARVVELRLTLRELQRYADSTSDGGCNVSSYSTVDNSSGVKRVEDYSAGKPATKHHLGKTKL